MFAKLSKSSRSTEYGTPIDLYNKLNNIFHFTLDPCTTEDNPLGTETFYTKEHDGLRHPWNANTFINPPFGKGVDKWICKMLTESDTMYDREWDLRRYVMLLPSRTDTRWFQDLICKNSCYIYFLKGRLKFINPELNFNADPHIIGSFLWIRNATISEKTQLITSIPGIMMDV